MTSEQLDNIERSLESMDRGPYIWTYGRVLSSVATGRVLMELDLEDDAEQEVKEFLVTAREDLASCVAYIRVLEHLVEDLKAQVDEQENK